MQKKSWSQVKYVLKIYIMRRGKYIYNPPLHTSPAFGTLSHKGARVSTVAKATVLLWQ